VKLSSVLRSKVTAHRIAVSRSCVGQKWDPLHPGNSIGNQTLLTLLDISFVGSFLWLLRSPIELPCLRIVSPLKSKSPRGTWKTLTVSHAPHGLKSRSIGFAGRSQSRPPLPLAQYVEKQSRLDWFGHHSIFN